MSDAPHPANHPVALAPAAPHAARYVPDADTWYHVVRAVGRMGYAGACAKLMRATSAHAHDAELLWLTRAVRCRRAPGEWNNETLLSRAARRLDAPRVAEILAACIRPACRAELLRAQGVWGSSALHAACLDSRCDKDCAEARTCLTRPTRPRSWR